MKGRLIASFVGTGGLAILAVWFLYEVIWFGRGSTALILLFQGLLGMDDNRAMQLYDHLFRSHAELIFLLSLLGTFGGLLHVTLRFFTRYFDRINQGIGQLLQPEAEIQLPKEMGDTERQLKAVQAELRRRTMEAKLAERRKNDLVMYLAHDIRTPLTSVIGYLTLLEEAPDLPEQQRTRYVQITLEKANRLEKMVQEFFDITRYNLQEITLHWEAVDLSYLLLQLSDEMKPVLEQHGNTLRLETEETMLLQGDPDQLARLFANLLKNAVSYSDSDTEIFLSAAQKGGTAEVAIRNVGKTIPKDKLAALFDPFYRLDDARTSDTGGSGLGLAIAKEIVTRHGGSIRAESGGRTIIFTVTLPTKQPEGETP